MAKLSDIVLEDVYFAARQADILAERGQFIAPTEDELKLRWRAFNERQISRIDADSTRSSITGY